MSTPRRIQRKRTKGWRMPPNTVYVGRPSKWGNPFVADDWRCHEGVWSLIPNRQLAKDLFRECLRKEGTWSPIPTDRWPGGKIPTVWTTVEDVRRELRGKNLACWCPLDEPCHADILLEIANVTYKCKQRPCLTCGNDFESEGAHNRMCPKCRKSGYMPRGYYQRKELKK